MSGLSSTALVPLQACIQEDASFSARVASLVKSQEQEIRATWDRKPEVAIVEVLWSPAHNSRGLRIKEITKAVNTLIRTRGETLEYNAIEIGSLLANLGIPRHRNGAGMELRFSREICQRLHELVVDFCLNVGQVQGCTMCSGL